MKPVRCCVRNLLFVMPLSSKYYDFFCSKLSDHLSNGYHFLAQSVTTFISKYYNFFPKNAMNFIFLFKITFFHNILVNMLQLVFSKY